MSLYLHTLNSYLQSLNHIRQILAGSKSLRFSSMLVLPSERWFWDGLSINKPLLPLIGLYIFNFSFAIAYTEHYLMKHCRWQVLNVFFLDLIHDITSTRIVTPFSALTDTFSAFPWHLTKRYQKQILNVLCQVSMFRAILQ